MASSHNNIQSDLENGRLVVHTIGLVMGESIDLETYLNSLRFMQENHGKVRAELDVLPRIGIYNALPENWRVLIEHVVPGYNVHFDSLSSASDESWQRIAEYYRKIGRLLPERVETVLAYTEELNRHELRSIRDSKDPSDHYVIKPFRLAMTADKTPTELTKFLKYSAIDGVRKHMESYKDKFGDFHWHALPQIALFVGSEDSSGRDLLAKADPPRVFDFRKVWQLW